MIAAVVTVARYTLFQIPLEKVLALPGLPAWYVWLYGAQSQPPAASPFTHTHTNTLTHMHMPTRAEVAARHAPARKRRAAVA